MINHYNDNNHRSLDDIEARFRLHILPVLGNRKAASITTEQLRAYTQSRRAEVAAAGTVNREMEAIRRAFCLGIEDRRLYWKPKIPMLEETNARKGFFERDAFDRMRQHMPDRRCFAVRLHHGVALV